MEISLENFYVDTGAYRVKVHFKNSGLLNFDLFGDLFLLPSANQSKKLLFQVNKRSPQS